MISRWLVKFVVFARSAADSPLNTRLQATHERVFINNDAISI
jgi:hypothetical protein